MNRREKAWIPVVIGGVRTGVRPDEGRGRFPCKRAGVRPRSRQPVRSQVQARQTLARSGAEGDMAPAAAICGGEYGLAKASSALATGSEYAHASCDRRKTLRPLANRLQPIPPYFQPPNPGRPQSADWQLREPEFQRRDKWIRNAPRWKFPGSASILCSATIWMGTQRQSVSCPRIFWTPICPTGGIHDEVEHEPNRNQRCE